MASSHNDGMFLQEIKAMMYSFGDSLCPYSDSAALVEHVTHQQIAQLIVGAANVTNMRGARSMSTDDILFLLRKDKDKLQGLVRHLIFKDVSKRVGGQSDEDIQDCDTFRQPAHKKQRFSLDFLSSIDQIGDDMDDTVHQERLRQRDAFTKNMDVDEYVQYTASRRVNFHKNSSKFKEWLDIVSLIDLKPSQEVIEVFGFLAYEVVREIVELSLLVKKDMESRSIDPSGPPTLSILPSSPSDFGSTKTFYTTPSSSSSNAAPSSSPSTPVQSATASPHTDQVTSPSVAVVNQAGNRKRKTVDILLEQPVIPRVGITTTHIREAMRRNNFQIGPLLPLSTHFTKPTFSQRSLCA